MDAAPGVRGGGRARFVLSVMVTHVVTYFVAGLVASRARDYAEVMGRPVILISLAMTRPRRTDAGVQPSRSESPSVVHVDEP